MLNFSHSVGLLTQKIKRLIWEENRCGKSCWITIFNGSVQVILQKTMIFSFKKGGVLWIFPSTNSLGHLLHDIPLTFTLTPSSSKVFPILSRDFFLPLSHLGKWKQKNGGIKKMLYPNGNCHFNHRKIMINHRIWGYSKKMFRKAMHTWGSYD